LLPRWEKGEREILRGGGILRLLRATVVQKRKSNQTISERERREGGKGRKIGKRRRRRRRRRNVQGKPKQLLEGVEQDEHR